METVFIAYTGGDQLIYVPPSETEGCPPDNISTFRVHGVFSTLEEYEIFARGYGIIRGLSGMNYMEIPLNPPNAMITRTMRTYLVVLNNDLEILSAELTDRKPWTDRNTYGKVDQTIETSPRRDEIYVYCYALDRDDACKIAYNECRSSAADDLPE